MNDSPVDFQTLFNVAMAVIWFLSGVIGNRVFTALKDLKSQDALLAKEVNEIKVKLPTEYVTKQDLKNMGDALFTKLDHIDNKLDGKADKHP